jgi:hypothetical protein
MAGTTGLEPATSAVTGQRSDQLSYVPRLFFNNLVICHIESGVSEFSLFSPHSTFSPLWTQFRASVDTTWTPRWTPQSPPQRQDKVYQINRSFGVRLPSHRHKKRSLLRITASDPHHSPFDGNSKPEVCSTCRIKAEGFIPSDPQMSKMLRNDGFVLPNSIREMKARSYPDLAARASWLIFRPKRCFRSN